MKFTRFSYKSARLRDIEKTFITIDRALFETTNLKNDENAESQSRRFNAREIFVRDTKIVQNGLAKLNDDELRMFQNCLDTMRDDLWLHHLIKVKTKARNSK